MEGAARELVRCTKLRDEYEKLGIIIVANAIDEGIERACKALGGSDLPEVIDAVKRLQTFQ
jgi:hypothetical protein